jgi:endogenous inhibitor of DNA gyrase (YacG/DUF329 family)
MTPLGSPCPICGKEARARGDNNASFPFCSSRCKQVDLGQWLDEKYRMPTQESPTDEVTPPKENGS